MRIERVIDALNVSIDNKVKGHFVLHISITNDSTFKVYKEYKYDLYYIHNKSKFKALSMVQKHRVPKEQEATLKDVLDEYFCVELFKWFNSDNYNDIIRGNYDI